MSEAQRRSKRPLANRPIRLDMGSVSFVKKGLSRFDPRDPYYFAVSLDWKRFVLLFLAAELAINMLFAALYLLRPGAIANEPHPGFLSAFFFSLETLATVGYGEMYPGTTYGHVVSSLEILVGTAFTAIMTGLLFIRFSKPKAKIVYAAVPVITRHNGKPTLMLRIGNARPTLLHHVRMSMHTLVRVTTDEGHAHANMSDLALVRASLPVMVIHFTMMHVIDETSPLFGLDPRVDETGDVRIFVTIGAHDPEIGQPVSDIHSFLWSDVRRGMRYVDAVRREDNAVVADYALLGAIVADGLETPIEDESAAT